MKDKKKSMINFNKVLYLFIIVISFSFAFVMLIKKQQNDNLGDVDLAYLTEKTVYNKQIVVQDLDSIYPRYFVLYFSGDEFVTHSYNYYNTESQYDLEFSRYIKQMVDYNRKEYMIRYIYNNGYGIYDNVKQDVSNILNLSNIKIIY